jgi:hypothetical protein
MGDLRAFRCWLPGQTDLGHAYTLASSADQARVFVARSPADVGFLSKASPHLVRCRRAPEHDRNPALNEGWCSNEDHVRLGAAVAEAEGNADG